MLNCVWRQIPVTQHLRLKMCILQCADELVYAHITVQIRKYKSTWYNFHPAAFAFSFVPSISLLPGKGEQKPWSRGEETPVSCRSSPPPPCVPALVWGIQAKGCRGRLLSLWPVKSLFAWFPVVGYPRENSARKDGSWTSYCLPPCRQVYGLHAGTTYAHMTLLTLGRTHSEDALQSHTNKAHLGWGGRKRDEKWEGTVPTEDPSLWSTCYISEVALSTHQGQVSEGRCNSGFTLNFSGPLWGLSSFLSA